MNIEKWREARVGRSCAQRARHRQGFWGERDLWHQPTSLGVVEEFGRGGGAALDEVGAVPVPGPAYLPVASQSRFEIIHLDYQSIPVVCVVIWGFGG
jgi:hypothetical protein